MKEVSRYRRVFLNERTPYGVETVEVIYSNNYSSSKEMRLAIKNMIQEYSLCGRNLYASQRGDKEQYV